MFFLCFSGFIIAHIKSVQMKRDALAAHVHKIKSTGFCAEKSTVNTMCEDTATRRLEEQELTLSALQTALRAIEISANESPMTLLGATSSYSLAYSVFTALLTFFSYVFTTTGMNY